MAGGTVSYLPAGVRSHSRTVGGFWRRLFSELLGTFFLVLAAAGQGMMGHAFPVTHGLPDSSW